MTNEKHERGVFKGRSSLFKNLFVGLAVGYILTGLVGSTWCARDVLTGAGPWILIFTLGTVCVIFIVPEILMEIALKNKNKEVVIVSVIINIIYLLIFGGLSKRPFVYDDEGGVEYHYAFGWRFIALSCLIISIALLILINHAKWSLKKNGIALLITAIVSCGLIGGVGVLTLACSTALNVSNDENPVRQKSRIN